MNRFLLVWVAGCSVGPLDGFDGKDRSDHEGSDDTATEWTDGSEGRPGDDDDDGTSTTIEVVVDAFSPGVQSGEEGMLVEDREQPIEVVFSARMDREATALALTVSSDWNEGRVWPGATTWEDDYTLVFVPEEPWADGYFSAVVSEEARSLGGVNLQSEFSWYFFVPSSDR